MPLHIPVLLKQTINYLDPKNGVIFDCTLGAGGHAKEILKGSKAFVVGIDKDGDALAEAKKNLSSFRNRTEFVRDDFSNIKKIAQQKKVLGKVFGILIDLGISSMQLDTPERGFSFQVEGPLDMRMDKRSSLTASEIVNSWPEEKIAEILWEYGEERLSRKIAKEIVLKRRKSRFSTTKDLSDFIASVIYGRQKIHSATRTFQALRIAVNRELESLKFVLTESLDVLESGGRIAVISFHSLEDRIVKRFFREMAKKEKLSILTKKPIIAQREEVLSNPRSRSAKMRVASRI